MCVPIHFLSFFIFNGWPQTIWGDGEILAFCMFKMNYVQKDECEDRSYKILHPSHSLRLITNFTRIKKNIKNKK